MLLNLLSESPEKNKLLYPNWSHRTYSFILKQEQQPQHIVYQTPDIFKHFLIECRALTVIR